MSKDQSKSSKSKSTPQAPQKVFDVMRPGKAPASATSRPVIVGHKPQVKEDMFVAGSGGSKLADNPFDKHDLMSHGKAAAFDAKPKPDNKDKTEPVTAPAVSDELVPRELGEPAPPATDADAAAPSNDAATAPVVEADNASQPATHEPAEIPQRAVEHTPDDPEITNLGLATDTPENTSEDFAKPKEIYESQVSGAEFSEPAVEPPKSQADNKVLSHDDVVAATGAPLLDHAFVSHHKAHHTKWWEWVLIMLLIVIIGLVALNFLLDAEVISLDLDLPHTNLLK